MPSIAPLKISQMSLSRGFFSKLNLREDRNSKDFNQGRCYVLYDVNENKESKSLILLYPETLKF